MSPYVKLPGAELDVGPRGHLLETLGDCHTGPAVGPTGRGHVHASPCCTSCADGGPCATGADNGRGLATIAVVGAAAAIGAAVLFPRAWRKFMDNLWG